MSSRINIKSKDLFHICLAIAICLLLAFVSYCLFASINRTDETKYLYIDRDDTIDSIQAKLSQDCHRLGVQTLTTLSRHFGYADNIHTGRYELSTSIGALQLFRHLRNGAQTPIMITVPSVRTTDRIAKEMAKNLMMSEEELLTFISSNDSLKPLHCDTNTVMALFIPDTYEMYWNISPALFMKRMQIEHDSFWDSYRKDKADALGLSPLEVSILASIVDEETANNAEKSDVAGMYYNRLRINMPLQADPTIKFALKQFELRRIYNDMLRIESPYNTYRNIGLPPGPIRIPSKAGLDAVLNLTRHEYLYMCAKEDFSGTHNFARTYNEHLTNARKYTEALNARGIK